MEGYVGPVLLVWLGDVDWFGVVCAMDVSLWVSDEYGLAVREVSFGVDGDIFWFYCGLDG